LLGCAGTQAGAVFTKTRPLAATGFPAFPDALRNTGDNAWRFGWRARPGLPVD